MRARIYISECLAQLCERDSYDDGRVLVVVPHRLHHARIRLDDSIHALVLRDVIGAEHEHDDVGARRADPPVDVVVGDVDGEVARVALVALMAAEILVLPVALLRAPLRPDELDPVRQIIGLQQFPQLRSPAGDLRDTISQRHFGHTC